MGKTPFSIHDKFYQRFDPVISRASKSLLMNRGIKMFSLHAHLHSAVDAVAHSAEPRFRGFERRKSHRETPFFGSYIGYPCTEGIGGYGHAHLFESLHSCAARRYPSAKNYFFRGMRQFTGFIILDFDHRFSTRFKVKKKKSGKFAFERILNGSRFMRADIYGLRSGTRAHYDSLQFR